MNDQSWMDEIHWQNLGAPGEIISDEEIYTLEMGDFLEMPEVDFLELAAFDPHIRALLN